MNEISVSLGKAVQIRFIDFIEKIEKMDGLVYTELEIEDKDIRVKRYPNDRVQNRVEYWEDKNWVPIRQAPLIVKAKILMNAEMILDTLKDQPTRNRNYIERAIKKFDEM